MPTLADGGRPESYATYDLFLSDGTFQPNMINDKYDQDTTTGQLVWSAYDQNYPAIEWDAPIAPVNTIKYRDNTGIEQVIANPTEGWITNVLFINGGRHVAYEISSADGRDLGWFALDEFGTSTPLLIPESHDLSTILPFKNIVGTPLGYLYGFEGSEGFSLVWGTVDSGEALLWSGIGTWDLIGTEPMTPVGNPVFSSVD